eukprot:3578367-Rhodomonas_salina.2
MGMLATIEVAEHAIKATTLSTVSVLNHILFLNTGKSAEEYRQFIAQGSEAGNMLCFCPRAFQSIGRGQVLEKLRKGGFSF